MLELYQTYQATDNQEILAKLINHKTVLHMIKRHLKDISANQIEIDEVKSTLFIYLVNRKNRLHFSHENKFNSYLFITIKGIVLNQLNAIKRKPNVYLNPITIDTYALDDFPDKVRKVLNQNPLFCAYLYEDKTLKELSEKSGIPVTSLWVAFKEIKEKLKSYYIEETKCLLK